MRKTLIFNGSPRKRGETIHMIEELTGQLEGEIKLINAYSASIAPCIDCRWCFKNKGCIRKDDMQELYTYIEECDHIIIASPIYFEELTGVLMAVMSRLQTYFSAKYIRKEESGIKPKTGGVILAAGSIGPREKAESTAEMLLSVMNCTNLETVYVDKTDRIPLKERSDWKVQINHLAVQLQS